MRSLIYNIVVSQVQGTFLCYTCLVRYDEVDKHYVISIHRARSFFPE